MKSCDCSTLQRHLDFLLTVGVVLLESETLLEWLWLWGLRGVLRLCFPGTPYPFQEHHWGSSLCFHPPPALGLLSLFPLPPF